jgi:pimeloyl-ACP methyl ester carboxylesterase
LRTGNSNYIHDFGAPVAYHLALARPDGVLGLIIQNGNAHEEGLGEAWDTAKAYWADPTPENRAALPDWLNFEGTREQYVGGVPERIKPLFAPESWHLDWERMSRPGLVDVQFRIFADYAQHVARFPEISALSLVPRGKSCSSCSMRRWFAYLRGGPAQRTR